jgi:hypothetical protein
MSTSAAQSSSAISEPGVAKVDMKFDLSSSPSRMSTVRRSSTRASGGGSTLSLKTVKTPTLCSSHDAAAWSHRPVDDDVRIGERFGERAKACGGRPRTARTASDLAEQAGTELPT